MSILSQHKVHKFLRFYDSKKVFSAAEVWDINETNETIEIEFSKSLVWLTSKVSSYPQDPLAIIVPDHF